ncbi:TPA: hypothetical protein N2C61_006467 [Pseudomonas aeruginosa]|uniref:hypothetical protein n=1 Tax=Alcaligenes xylosoxydans xylosoxydans TaxID=85698 RepID=UPI0005F8D7EC|nr:hypothetical protein [Achromobacter xylosoxidans]HCL4135302.1 hypothetical protein [Pseudomonas aeruginosa]
MNQTNPSGLYKSIAMLGNGLAALAALFGTPILFDATRGMAWAYLTKTWGRDFSAILVWILGAIEAYVIYAAVSFVLSAALVWAMTALAARSFRE